MPGPVSAHQEPLCLSVHVPRNENTALYYAWISATRPRATWPLRCWDIRSACHVRKLFAGNNVRCAGVALHAIAWRIQRVCTEDQQDDRKVHSATELFEAEIEVVAARGGYSLLISERRAIIYA